MLRSLASIYHGSLIAIILTGMGADGTEGCRIIRRHGGMVIAQDQESSVVWGMPGSVVKSDSADFVLPLRNIAETLSELDRNGSDSGIIKKEREARA
jgi:two-component system chemotaxis response regulator CheB